MNSPLNNVTDVDDGDEDRISNKDKILMESREVEISSFSCPYHACHTCTPKDIVRIFFKCRLCACLLLFSLLKVLGDEDCHYLISNHVISHQITSCHVISYQIMSYHITSYHIISYHIVSHQIIIYYALLYYIISSYLIVYSVILPFVSAHVRARFFLCLFAALST